MREIRMSGVTRGEVIGGGRPSPTLLAEVGPAAGGGVVYVIISTVMSGKPFKPVSLVRNNPHPCTMAAAG